MSYKNTKFYPPTPSGPGAVLVQHEKRVFYRYLDQPITTMYKEVEFKTPALAEMAYLWISENALIYSLPESLDFAKNILSDIESAITNKT